MSETPLNEIVAIAEAVGAAQAEMLRGLLKAQGIEVMLSEESAARTIGISLPGMGIVQIFVRVEQAEAARAILQDYEAGNFENETFLPNPDETE